MSSPFNQDERDIEVSMSCCVSDTDADTIKNDLISLRIREQTHNMQTEALQFEVEPNEVTATISITDTNYGTRYRSYKWITATCDCNDTTYQVCNKYRIYRKHIDKRAGTLTLTAYSSLYQVLNAKIDDVAVMDGDNVYNLLSRVFSACGVASDKVIMSQSVFSNYTIPYSYQSSYSVAQILNQVCAAFAINIFNDRNNNIVVRPFSHVDANADGEDYSDDNQICDIVNSTDLTDRVSAVTIGYTTLKQRNNSVVLSVRNCDFAAGGGTTEVYKFDTPYVAKISCVKIKNKNIVVTGVPKCTQSKIQIAYTNKSSSAVKADMDVYSVAIVGNEREWQYKVSGKGREIEVLGNDYIQSKAQIDSYIAKHYRALVELGNEYLYEIETVGSLSIKPNMALDIVSDEFDDLVSGKIVCMETEMSQHWITGRVWVYDQNLYVGM